MTPLVPTPVLDEVDYPTSDGEPMGETPLHWRVMLDAVDTLEDFYVGDPMTYVSGNMLMYYVKGDPRKLIVPDVFVAKGVAKDPMREIYLVWREGKVPDVTIEVTSKTTADRDQEEKWYLYQDVLKVPEYFLFHPRAEYLDPPLKAYRLKDGVYVPIEPVDGRLPSEVLGLHLEGRGHELRFYDPKTGKHLVTPRERVAQAEQSQREAEEREQEEKRARQQAEEARRRAEEKEQEEKSARQHAEEARRQAEAKERQAEEARRQTEAELEKLRQQLEILRRQGKPPRHRQPASDGYLPSMCPSPHPCPVRARPCPFLPEGV
jgi:Uma2 family endonuclease